MVHTLCIETTIHYTNTLLHTYRPVESLDVVVASGYLVATKDLVLVCSPHYSSMHSTMVGIVWYLQYLQYVPMRVLGTY